MNKIPRPTKEVLAELYLEQQMTLAEIGSRYACSTSVVLDWLRRLDICRRGRGGRPRNLSGKRLGRTLVVERRLDEKGRPRWLCRCDCGHERLLKAQVIYEEKIEACRSCVEAPNWAGVGQMPGAYYSAMRISARNRSISFDVTKEDLWGLFTTQGGRCALTGELLTFGVRGHRKSRTASLDRIDSAKGYVLGNVQWVHRLVNYMKMDIPQADFVAWCEKVARGAKQHADLLQRT